MDSLVGFRFKPTNEEIISLQKKKMLDPDFSVHTIKEIDFYSFDPWDLPRKCPPTSNHTMPFRSVK